MKLIVRTPVAQKCIDIPAPDALHAAIRTAFDTTDFGLFENPERTQPIDPAALSDGSIIYMSYAVPAPERYTPANTCTHSPDAVCPRCASLDPLQHRAPSPSKAKYLSRAAYAEALRLRGEQPPVHDYALRQCTDHPAKVTCGRCRDRTISLLPQLYRPIDYVEFDSPSAVGALVDRWRRTGRQQLGLLIGRPADHPFVEGGRKAVVAGIWEIDQEGFPEGVVPLCVPERFAAPSLQILGVIYTDLFLRDQRLFSYKRARDYFISGAELCFLYEMKTQMRLDDFVAVCVSADGEGNATPRCFMLTDQFLALMRAGALRVVAEPGRMATDREIRYMILNEYGKTVPLVARPLVPLDYFVVVCESGTSAGEAVFPGEERLAGSGESAVAQPLSRRRLLAALGRHFGGEYPFEKFQSFAVLMAFCKHYAAPGPLIEAVAAGDRAAFAEICASSVFREFVAQFEGEKKWACAACTYANVAGAAACEMCGSAKS